MDYEQFRKLAILIRWSWQDPALAMPEALWFALKYMVHIALGHTGRRISIRPVNSDLVWIRAGTSDLEILLQHYVYRELQHSSVTRLSGVHKIVDAGANIGLSTLVLSRMFPESRMLAIEPEADNFQMLVTNCQSLIDSNRLKVEQAAFYPEEVNVRLQTEERSSWNYVIQEAPNHDDPVPVIVIDKITDYFSGPPDLVKLDIEGSETAFFKHPSFMSLVRTTTILVELHGPAAYIEFFSRIREWEVSAEQVGEYWKISPLTICAE